jgi:hypothetical protein
MFFLTQGFYSDRSGIPAPVLFVIPSVSEGSVWAGGTMCAPPSHTVPSLTLRMT